jgi:hypothetical protein
VDAEVKVAPQEKRTLRQTFWRGIDTGLGFLRLHIWPILAFVLLAVIYFGVFHSAPNDEVRADDVASAWNDGIARLGILPVYPASEDFNVGDVWATIRKADDTDPNDQDTSAKRNTKSTWLGKSVRIGYIDLRPDIEEANEKKPVFPDTSNYTPGEASHGEVLLKSSREKAQERLTTRWGKPMQRFQR